MRHSTLAGTIPLLLLLATGEATAHAFLERADPRDQHDDRKRQEDDSRPRGAFDAEAGRVGDFEAEL